MRTTNCVLLAFSVGTFGGLGQVLALGQKSIALEDLTVPTERLPVTCRLTNLTSLDVSHDAFIAALRSIRPLLVTTNPWIERDRRTVSQVRLQMERMRHAPPEEFEDTSRRFWAAEDVEAVYVAIYGQPESEQVTVYARELIGPFLRVSEPRQVKGLMVAQVEIGPIVASVYYGDGSPCFKAIETHLNDLRRDVDALRR